MTIKVEVITSFIQNIANEMRAISKSDLEARIMYKWGCGGTIRRDRIRAMESLKLIKKNPLADAYDILLEPEVK